MSLSQNDKEHINLVLKELAKVYAKGDYGANLNSIFLLEYELMLTNPKWDYQVMKKAIHDLVMEGKSLTYDSVYARYPHAKKTLTYLDATNRSFNFYIYVNHPLPDSFSFLGWKVTRVKSKKKIAFLKEQARLHSGYADPETALKEREANGYRFYSYRITGNSFDKTFTRFRETVSLVKGILDYTFTKNMFAYAPISFRSRVMTRFSIPEFVVILQKGNHIHYHLDREMLVKPFGEIGTVLPKETTALLNLFKKLPPEKSTLGLIQKALCLYNKAMDTLYRRGSYQFFWNILEEITLSQDTGGKPDEVIRKLQNFFTPAVFDLYRKLFDDLKRTRNLLVHQGIDNTNDAHVNFLKMLSENCIDELIKRQKDFDTISKLQICYRNKNLSKEQLGEELFVIKYKLKRQKS